MAKIFLSYRRRDSGYVAKFLKERLERQFSENSVFLDIDNIPIGVDFREHIDRAVRQCDVMLVVIGDAWLTAEKGNGRDGLFEERDFVRTEIEAAMRREIPIVPVLVGTARMPAADDLPESIRDLSYRNAAELRAGGDFDSHMARLVESLGRSLNAGASTRPQSVAASARSPQAPGRAPRGSPPSNRQAVVEAFAGVPYAFVEGAIPRDKLGNALEAFASGVNLNDVVLLYDGTVFGSAKAGFLLTETAVFWRNGSTDPEWMLFDDVETVQTLEAFSHIKVFLNLKRIDVRHPKVAHPLAAFLSGIIGKRTQS